MCILDFFLLRCVQEEQLYTWATVGLPVSTNLWELYGGQKTGKERSLKTAPRQQTARAPPTQVGYVHMSPVWLRPGCFDLLVYVVYLFAFALVLEAKSKKINKSEIKYIIFT